MTGFQVSNRADDDRVLCGHVQDPLIVLQPGARFDLDGAHDAETFGNFAISAGQSRLVEYGVPLVGPRYALGTGRIEEMNVRIEDRDRYGPRQPVSNGYGGHYAQKASTVHLGIVSRPRYSK